jgi:hypothetical protein
MSSPPLAGPKLLTTDAILLKKPRHQLTGELIPKLLAISKCDEVFPSCSIPPQ